MGKEELDPENINENAIGKKERDKEMDPVWIQVDSN